MTHLALFFAGKLCFVFVDQIGVSCVYMKGAGYVDMDRLTTGLCFGFWWPRNGDVLSQW